MGGNRDFVRKNAATKRAVRALLQANNVCATNPEETTRFLVDRGFTANYDYALQSVRELPYARLERLQHRALRMQEAGYIKASPNTILAKGTDWRFPERAEEGIEGMVREISLRASLRLSRGGVAQSAGVVWSSITRAFAHASGSSLRINASSSNGL